MAEALARGFIGKGISIASNMFCTDPAAARKDVFQSFGVNPCNSNIEVSEPFLIFIYGIVCLQSVFWCRV